MNKIHEDSFEALGNYYYICNDETFQYLQQILIYFIYNNYDDDNERDIVINRIISCAT